MQQGLKKQLKLGNKRWPEPTLSISPHISFWMLPLFSETDFYMARNMAAGSNSCLLCLKHCLQQEIPLVTSQKILGKDLIGLPLVRCPSLDQSAVYLGRDICSIQENPSPLLSWGQSQSESIASPRDISIVSLRSFSHYTTQAHHLVAVYFHQPMSSVAKLLTCLLPCEKEKQWERGGQNMTISLDSTFWA